MDRISEKSWTAWYNQFHVLLDYAPKNIIGIDSGIDIINTNKKRFANNGNIQMIQGNCDNLPIENDYADLVILNLQIKL